MDIASEINVAWRAAVAWLSLMWHQCGRSGNSGFQGVRMKVAKDMMVTLDYRVADLGEATLQYLHGGYKDIFAKIEEALDGKVLGDSIRVTLDPRDAFGEYDPALMSMETADSFEIVPQIGVMFERECGGETILFRVTEVTDGKVVVDGNHPWAGMTLDFSATVTALRLATRQEIAAKVSNHDGYRLQGAAGDR